MRPIVLYGPPAVGKDTVTSALSALDPAYRLFPLLKAGLGRTAGYRMIPLHELGGLISRGQLILRWTRYGNTYAIDRAALDTSLAAFTPILHFADPYHVTTLIEATDPTEWLVVGLTCPREIAADRLAKRNPADVDERLAVFDRVPPIGKLGTIELDTSTMPPQVAAELIDQAGRQAVGAA